MPSRLVDLALIVVGLVGAARAHAYGLTSRGAPGDGLFPFIAAVGLIAFVGLGLALDVLRRRAPAALGEGLRGLFLLTVLVAVYAVVLPKLGYVLTTAALLVAIAKLASRGLSWTRAGVVAAALAVGTFLLFTRGLGVPLPVGLAGF